MSVPGSNLLNMAFRLIAKQTFLYYATDSRQLQSNAQWLTHYRPPVTVQGSWQPVPRSLYAQMGLDLQSFYANFFLSRDILDVDRDIAGDQFNYNGDTYQCISKTPWFAVDGWDQVLTIKVLPPRSLL